MLKWMRLLTIATMLLITGVIVAQDAVVPRDNFGLRVRAVPITGEVITHLEGESSLILLGRNSDGSWVQIQTPRGEQGWVKSSYLQFNIDVNGLPILDTSASSDNETVPVVSVETSDPIPNQESQQPVAQSSGNATTIVGGLNMRSAPGLNSTVIGSLAQGTLLQIIGRSSDFAWLQVQTPTGELGWVSAQYVDIATDLTTVAASDGAVQEQPPINFDGVIGNITGRAREIFLFGQSLGNRANVFAKVGDSITVSDYFLSPFVRTTNGLNTYGYLQPALNFFNQTRARNGTSFNNISVAAGIGWSTAHMFDTNFSNGWLCEAGEFPLACEYRLTRPAVAVVMLGTNDVTWMSAETYYLNLIRIVDVSADMGVIPILCTIPPRPGLSDKVDEFNRLVERVAGEKGVPLCQYGRWMQGAPNGGISGDGIHPSVPPGGYRASVTFTAENLNYGYTLRNIVTLHALDAVWRQVIQI